MLGSLTLYLKGMRIMMFQLSGFYCNRARVCKSFYVLYGIESFQAFGVVNA